MTDAARPAAGHAEIDETLSARRETSPVGAFIRAQPFWVLVAILAIGIVMR